VIRLPLLDTVEEEALEWMATTHAEAERASRGSIRRSSPATVKTEPGAWLF
jgi:hypothetical protein